MSEGLSSVLCSRNSETCYWWFGKQVSSSNSHQVKLKLDETFIFANPGLLVYGFEHIKLRFSFKSIKTAKNFVVCLLLMSLQQYYNKVQLNRI